MSFELDRQLVKLTNLNIRNELHGDEHQLAVDLQFSARLSNDVLSEFSSTLKSSLYMKDDSPQQELMQDDNHLPILKNPKMGTIKWDEKYDHARAVVHHGLDEQSDVIFSDAKVNKFSFEAQQGGTVIVNFRVQGHPTEQQVAKLTSVLGEEVEVSIESDGGEDEDETMADFGAAGNAGYADSGSAGVTADEEEDDELYKPAMELVIRDQKATLSHLQKNLHIGQPRASKLIARMEEQGVITAPDEGGMRTVVIPASALEQDAEA